MRRITVPSWEVASDLHEENHGSELGGSVRISSEELLEHRHPIHLAKINAVGAHSLQKN